MRQNNKLWFTLVELLVVITILAIISVVAYQNFGWAVDKAIWGRKISDVSTIETALQQYKTDKNYYPSVDVSEITNVWWYDSSTWAKASNLLIVSYDWDALSGVTLANWWWKVLWISNFSTKQIWAKWTISQAKLEKKYLSKDLYDPEIWDLKLNDGTSLIEKWIWRYVYAAFKKSSTTWNWTTNFNWNAYNIAFTVKKDWSDTYMTKIVGDYDTDSCYEDKAYCPETLIGSWPIVLKNNEVLSWALTDDNFHIPYAVADFPQ